MQWTRFLQLSILLFLSSLASTQPRLSDPATAGIHPDFGLQTHDKSTSSPPVSRGQNILLISIDTLRADRLSCYGYRANTTPVIDRWASEGVLFENAYTDYPLTLPAHSTLLTGTYPLYHGVRENVGFSLARGQTTLAGLLRENKYDTAGFIGSYVLASEFGIARGFDTYDEDFGVSTERGSPSTALRRPAGQVADRFLAFLRKRQERNFFAFVHFYDPHAPCPEGYDREVSRVDLSIGTIDASMRKTGLLDKTHIILVSDHGESLGEHQESGHGFFLYDSTLHVPMIVRPAAGFEYSRKRVANAVSLVDVVPTILQLAGLRVPPHLQGRSLVRLMTGKDASESGQYAETYVPQLHFGWSPLRSYRLGHYVFIDAPRPEFYDIAADRGQVSNIIGQNQALATQYRARLEGFSARYRAQPGAVAPGGPVLEANERLAALGYVRMGAFGIKSNFGNGVDPKDRISAFESYHEILNEVGSRNIRPGILDRLGALRQIAPEVRSLDFLEAQVFEGLERIPEARQKYLQGLEIEPENNVARAGYANLLLRTGQMEEAENELRRVTANNPGDYRSRNNLAGIYASKGKTEAALAGLKQALATRPTYAAGWLNLGQLHARMRNWKEAETALRKAANLDRNNATAHFLLAQVLDALGKKPEAADHLKTALKLDPRLGGRIPEKSRP